MDLVEAHRHSSDHREMILASALVGCFYCLEVFPPKSIRDWIDGGQTALCPNCGVDALLGDKIGVAMKRPFLEKMRVKWFDTQVPQEEIDRYFAGKTNLREQK
jgi:NAD-dependent SIR2 family protein deacetylase